MTTKTDAQPLHPERVRAHLVRVALNVLRRPRTLEQARAFIRNGAKPELTDELKAEAHDLADHLMGLVLAMATGAQGQPQGPLQGLAVVLHTSAEANRAPGRPQDRLQSLLQSLMRLLQHWERQPPPGSSLEVRTAWHRAKPLTVGHSDARAATLAWIECFADPVLAVREGREGEWTALQTDPQWAQWLKGENPGERSS